MRSMLSGLVRNSMRAYFPKGGAKRRRYRR